jgi:hypothetical protein
VAYKDDLSEFANLEFGLKRAITPQEVDNLLSCYAFVHIVNPKGVGSGQIHFIRSNSGWLILNYGNAMAASPGETLYDHGNYITDENGNLVRVCSGTGTRVSKIINTAADMVRIVKEEEHWPEIYILNGHPLMRWGIWKAAKDLQIPVIGYEPSKEDEAKYDRIVKACPNTLVIQPPSLGGSTES